MVNSPRSFAIFAFSLIAAVLLAGGGVLYVERVNQAREQHLLSNAQMLGFAAIEYSQDHNNHYPDAGRWEQELAPYFAPKPSDLLNPPPPFGGTPRRFSLNPAVSGKTSAQISGLKTPWLFYESVSKQHSASDDLENWPDPKRDGGNFYAVVYAEGYAYLRPPVWKQQVKQHLTGL